MINFGFFFFSAALLGSEQDYGRSGYFSLHTFIFVTYLINYCLATFRRLNSNYQLPIAVQPQLQSNSDPTLTPRLPPAPISFPPPHYHRGLPPPPPPPIPFFGSAGKKQF